MGSGKVVGQVPSPDDSRALSLEPRDLHQTLTHHRLVMLLLFGFLIYTMGTIDDPRSCLPPRASSWPCGAKHTAAQQPSAPQEASRAR